MDVMRMTRFEEMLRSNRLSSEYSNISTASAEISPFCALDTAVPSYNAIL